MTHLPLVHCPANTNGQVVNDDGPPSNQSSPYVHSFVKTLQSAGHVVSVVLPHVQRSWIGKAHFVGHVTEPTYFRPGTLHEDDGTTHERPLSQGAEEEEWVLVNGSPATCTQLGLFHLFQDRGPVDLVVSGPNYGRNSTALFSLSSGTIGGAMEAAVCRRKAIALSYAFYSRDHDPVLIAGASRLAVKLVEHLYRNWSDDVDLYSINVPLIEGVEQNKVMYTNVLQNYWASGSSFQEIEPTEDNDGEEPNKQEKEIRQQTIVPTNTAKSLKPSRHKHMHFKWAPKFTDIHKSIEENPPGNDGWAIKEGVTPLRANFMHASSDLQGELKLSVDKENEAGDTPWEPAPRFYALIDYQDPYVQPLILSALQSQLPAFSYTLISSLSELPNPEAPLLQITSYESLDFSHLLAHRTTSFANAYIIRKALIRKHYLAHTVTSWLTKNPDSPLKNHVKPTLDFELDYAEFLDEALVEAYELHESFARNQDRQPVDCEWWILKPSMSDRGQGIRLFSTEDGLRAIFEQWEADLPEIDSDSNSETEASKSPLPDTTSPPFDPTAPIPSATKLSSYAETETETKQNPTTTSIITSQLRHFIAQPYIHPPLLFPVLQNCKFHIRSYVLAVGALRVYVYREMLALFAAEPYSAPGDPEGGDPNGEAGLRAHLTNTCLQSDNNSITTRREGSVRPFWSLPSSSSSSSTRDHLPANWHSATYTTICGTTSALFRAAAQGQQIHFQTLPNAFEIFGLDWLVDAQGVAWLLEVNAFPDFGQSGEEREGKGVVRGLWEEVVRIGLRGYFGLGKGVGGEEEEVEGGEGRMTKVLDVDMGRG